MFLYVIEIWFLSVFLAAGCWALWLYRTKPNVAIYPLHEWIEVLGYPIGVWIDPYDYAKLDDIIAKKFMLTYGFPPSLKDGSYVYGEDFFGAIKEIVEEYIRQPLTNLERLVILNEKVPGIT